MCKETVTWLVSHFLWFLRCISGFGSFLGYSYRLDILSGNYGFHQLYWEIGRFTSGNESLFPFQAQALHLKQHGLGSSFQAIKSSYQALCPWPMEPGWRNTPLQNVLLNLTTHEIQTITMKSAQVHLFANHQPKL